MIGQKNKVNRYDIASSVMLADLEHFSGQLSAETQRQVFGRNIFGRKTITIDCEGQGRVYGAYSVSFGTDSAFFNKSFEQIAELSNDPSQPIAF